MYHWIENHSAYFEPVDEYKERISKRTYDTNDSRGSIELVRKLSLLEKRTIEPFVKKYLIYEKDSIETSTTLYNAYCRFCKENNFKPLTKPRFAYAIKNYVFINEAIPKIWIKCKSISTCRYGPLTLLNLKLQNI